MRKVFVLGGYGNFGKRIARRLVEKNIPVVILGRNPEKAIKLQREINSPLVDISIITPVNTLENSMILHNPLIMVDATGPFQVNNYETIELCLKHTVHYVDISDGRDFVCGVSAFDELARHKGLTIVSGASTVPGLSSAVLDYYKHDFSSYDSLQYGISPGQKAERGLAVTQAVLGYLGKPLKAHPGGLRRYGWQNIYMQRYPDLGLRFMANCDIPDLDLLPQVYGLKSIHFSAGMENPFLHLLMWMLSWVIRAGVPLPLMSWASFFLKASHWFNFYGSADGGMHMKIKGKNYIGQDISKDWFIIARNGDGPFIPTIPAIILAEKLFHGAFNRRGAFACVGLVTLDEYLCELKGKRIKTYS